MLLPGLLLLLRIVCLRCNATARALLHLHVDSGREDVQPGEVIVARGVVHIRGLEAVAVATLV